MTIVTEVNSEYHVIHFVTFECQPSNEVRGKNNISAKECCNKWSIKRTATNMWLRNGNESKIQGNCTGCKNRPRLDLASIVVFSTKDEAIKHIDYMNSIRGE